MAMSNRDKMLALVLPALIVFIGYILFFFRGKLAENGKAAAELEAARAVAPSSEVVQTHELKVLELEKLRDEIKKELNENKSRCQALLAACAASTGRSERVAKLTRLMNKHDLDLLEDRNAEAAKEGKLSRALEKLSERAADVGGPRPELRQVRFHGRYRDVHQLLQELSQGDVFAIPVGLTMSTNSDPERREWTMLVWI